MSNINKTNKCPICSSTDSECSCSLSNIGQCKYNSLTELPKFKEPKDVISGSPESMARGPMRCNGIGINAYGLQSSMPGMGAQFKDISCKIKPKHYEKVERVTLVAPWNPIAIAHEATYMNRIKRLNEPPVETYRELELSSVPADNYEEYEPIIYTEEEPVKIPSLNCHNTIEGFSNKENNYVYLILSIIFTIFCLYYFYCSGYF